jgi:cytochrome c oxidase cbb3-type subunit III
MQWPVVTTSSRVTVWWTMSCLLILCVASAGLAQDASGARSTRAPAIDSNTKNPLEGRREAIASGSTIFRSRCTGCHGVDARGFVGPDLTNLWAGGATDGQLFRIVQRGVPGTEMPPFDIRSQDEEIWQTLAYVKTLNAPVGGREAPTGDAANGERIFRATCTGCHIVNGRGGELGPNLSRIGSARSRATLKEKVRGTSSIIRPGYEPVTLVMKDGQRVRGVKKNEDDWSIQIMDTGTRLQGYLKTTLAEVISDKQSVMPAYGPAQLTDHDLDDMLRYLGTLRATDAGRR